MDNNYIIVDIEDIIGFAKKASLDGNKDLSLKLSEYFSNADSMEVKIPRNTNEAEYIISKNKKYDITYFINLETLSLAFSRLYLDKNNKELFIRIKKYLHDFRDNIKKGISNKMLKSVIEDDKEAFNYIKEFNNFDDYEKSISLKNKEKNKRIIKEDNYIKGKTIIY